MYECHVGDRPRLSVIFTVGGTNTDPTTISLTVQDPTGTNTSYTTGDVTKASTGSYYKDVTVNIEGTWAWRWAGTGSVIAADEGFFHVLESVIV